MPPIMTKNEQNEMEMLTLAGVLLERHHIRPANVVSSCLAKTFHAERSWSRLFNLADRALIARLFLCPWGNISQQHDCLDG